ncbi:hypothetical protein [Vibrio sp. 10N.261.46.A3]|uniref:hypothetical protein n=1 Tax=Vibrio sp. 10N.261.46.A3 TaxID=3229658 RepID=UPI00355471A0
MMSPNTRRLLDEAKKKNKKKVSANSYVVGMSDDSRKIHLKATCRRVMRTNKKAIELLADK